jgi:D-proline reductase (dithiol) PrdB
MADRDIKASGERFEAEIFATPAFTIPPKLSEATVAVVSTASLHHEDQDNFLVAETGYKVLRNDLRDYQTGQWSPNFDSLGFAADFNTIIPLDRLDELAEQGIIGKVSDVHLSYAGAQYDLSAIRLDSGPAGARLLKDSGVDVVLLTPV